MKVTANGEVLGWMTGFEGIVSDVADAAKASTDYERANLAMIGLDFESNNPGATADLVELD